MAAVAIHGTELRMVPCEGGSRGPTKPKCSGGLLTNVAALLPVLGSCLGFSTSFHKGRDTLRLGNNLQSLSPASGQQLPGKGVLPLPVCTDPAPRASCQCHQVCKKWGHNDMIFSSLRARGLFHGIFEWKRLDGLKLIRARCENPSGDERGSSAHSHPHWDMVMLPFSCNKMSDWLIISTATWFKSSKLWLGKKYLFFFSKSIGNKFRKCL